MTLEAHINNKQAWVKNHSTPTGDSLIANFKDAGKDYLPQELRIDVKTLNFLDPSLVDNFLDAFKDNSLMWYIGSYYKWFSTGDLYWLFGKCIELYPHHPRRSEIEKSRSIIVKHLSPHLSHSNLSAYLMPQSWIEKKRDVLQKIWSYIRREEITDATEVNQLADDFSRFKSMYSQQSSESFLEKLTFKVTNTTSHKDEIELLAIIDANIWKDRSKNIYDWVVLQKEREYSLNRYIDLHYDIPTISNWFNHTEKFDDHYEFGQASVTFEVKKIMVRYGLDFTTAFLIYRIEFLKKHDSEYFTRSTSLDTDVFSQTQNYDANIPKDELIALRQYQTWYVSYINYMLRTQWSKKNNIATILTNRVSAAIERNKLQHATTLYRLVYRDWIKQWENKKVWDTIIDLWFTSTSHTEKFWKKSIKDYKWIVIKIYSPVWTPYAHMEEHFSWGSTIVGGLWWWRYNYTNQDEILLQKWTKYRINKIYPNEDWVMMYEVSII